MDTQEAEAHRRVMTLAAAIERELGNRTKKWLADTAGYDVSQLSRLLNGQQVPLTLEQVRSFEDALALPHGFLFRAGGYIDDPADLGEAIRAATELDRYDRRALSDLYEAARRRSSPS